MRLADLKVIGHDLRFASTVLRGKPYDVMVQVTNRCNMECSFCDFWPNPAPRDQELSVAEFERLARELAGLGTFLVSIEGGEPLVRKDLKQIVAAFASQGHITALFTNGWFITEQNAADLFDAGLVHASVSIDFAEPARHDHKRRLAGASDRAFLAVDILRRAAPRGGKQVNVMTVVMEENFRELEALLQRTRDRGVGHQLTLLATGGFRRGKNGDALPSVGVGEHLQTLWKKYPHVRFFREYFARMDDFLGGRPMPRCHAGVASFNIDHVGNVSPCIERIDEPVGNVRRESLAELYRRVSSQHERLSSCQRCWTACRGLTQALSGEFSAQNWLDLAARTRTL